MTESRRVSNAPKARFCKVFFPAILAGVIAAGAAVPALAATPLQLTYQVSHSVFGTIGTYTNTIIPTSTGTEVKTRTQFNVKLLGMRVYSEQARRVEEWRGNRLVSFASVTDKNGSKPLVVKGVASGNNFMITSPQGTVAAPANVRPANPWSAVFLGSNTMMRPDTGKIEHVQVVARGPATVVVDHQSVPTQKYEVKGDRAYTVYLDGRGVPVKFIVDDSSGNVTFSLIKCGGCSFAMSDLANYHTPN